MQPYLATVVTIATFFVAMPYALSRLTVKLMKARQRATAAKTKIESLTRRNQQLMSKQERAEKELQVRITI